MYTLYSIAGTCSTGITVLLESLGSPYQIIQRDDVTDYKDKIPTGQVPALELEDGSIITEGAAIALYLLERHAPKSMSDAPEEQAQFHRWLMFNYATLHPSYSQVFTAAFKVKLSDDAKNEILPLLAERVSNNWAVVDKHLTGRRYMFGESPSIIDYLLALYVTWHARFPENVTITLGTNAKRLVAEVSALPEFKNAFIKENIPYKSAA